MHVVPLPACDEAPSIFRPDRGKCRWSVLSSLPLRREAGVVRLTAGVKG